MHNPRDSSPLAGWTKGNYSPNPHSPFQFFPDQLQDAWTLAIRASSASKSHRALEAQGPTTPFARRQNLSTPLEKKS